MAKHNKDQAPTGAGQEPQRTRHVSAEVFDNAFRYRGHIGRALFALDVLLARMYQEQQRQYQEAATIGNQALAAQIADEARRLQAAAWNMGSTVLGDEEHSAVAEAERYLRVEADREPLSRDVDNVIAQATQFTSEAAGEAPLPPEPGDVEALARANAARQAADEARMAAAGGSNV